MLISVEVHCRPVVFEKGFGLAVAHVMCPVDRAESKLIFLAMWHALIQKGVNLSMSPAYDA